jgi:hypothetical protein
MRQITFACQPSFEKSRASCREQFLTTIEAVVPRSELEALIEPRYPKADRPGSTLARYWRMGTPSLRQLSTIAKMAAILGPAFFLARCSQFCKNSLCVGNPRGGRTAAILDSLTSTCRRHEIDFQLYLTQLLINLPILCVSQLPPVADRWVKVLHAARNAAMQNPVLQIE